MAGIMAGRLEKGQTVERWLSREEITNAINNHLRMIVEDVEIKPEKVVEIPSDGCRGHLGMREWHTWCARWGEFLVVAIDSDGLEPNIFIH